MAMATITTRSWSTSRQNPEMIHRMASFFGTRFFNFIPRDDITADLYKDMLEQHDMVSRSLEMGDDDGYYDEEELKVFGFQ